MVDVKGTEAAGSLLKEAAQNEGFVRTKIEIVKIAKDKEYAENYVITAVIKLPYNFTDAEKVKKEIIERLHLGAAVIEQECWG